MSDQTLYDDDILLWSEQQAELIRRLGRTRRDVLPNDFDVENVAEEIESVGRSELATVESYVQLILLHLMKLVVEADSDAVRHWRTEIAGFHFNLQRRYAPSMRQRFDINEIWNATREQLRLGYDDAAVEAMSELPRQCPISLDDLLEESINIGSLVERVRSTAAEERP